MTLKVTSETAQRPPQQGARRPSARRTSSSRRDSSRLVERGGGYAGNVSIPLPAAYGTLKRGGATSMCSAISRRTSTCSGGRRSKKSSHASHLPFDPALAEADPLIEDFARFWDEEPSPLERRKPPRRCSNASGRTAAPSSPVRPRHPFVQPRRPATDAGFARTGTGVAGSSPLAPPTNSYAKSRHVPPPRRRGCVLRGTCVKCDKPAQIAAAPRSRCRRATDEDHLDFPGLGEVKEALVRAGARKPTTSGSLRSRPSTTHEALSHEPEHHARKRTRARSAVEGRPA